MVEAFDGQFCKPTNILVCAPVIPFFDANIKRPCPKCAKGHVGRCSLGSYL